MVALQTACNGLAFLDCKTEIQPILSDQEALEKIKLIQEEGKFKFSSECLEILLLKNFSLSTGYLIDEVYPKTRVDAEIIVKKVENDIIRKQNYILY
jgi:hypothetical protein